MGRLRTSSVSGARWLVGVLGAVVLSFTIASAVGEHLESAIAGRANDIVGNAMPSVHLLSGVRGDLRQIDVALDRYAAASADERLDVGNRIAAVRQDVDATLATYRTLPFFKGEPGIYAHVEAALVGLDRRIAEYLSGTEPRALATLHGQLQLLDAAVQQSIAFDASQGQRLGLEIERIRGETRTAVVLLDAMSVLLAIGAGWLALRQLQHAARAQRAEREAGERRERELAAQNEALGEFSGRVAHDVLSPLSTAMLALDMVQQHAGANDPATHRMAAKGVAAVTRVQTLVQALLAFSKAGGHPEPGATTEIAPVISDVIDGLSGEAADHRVALFVDNVRRGAIACSTGVLLSILSNLVRNAIKYMGDAVDRRIEVRVIDRGERWRIEVEDTGPGIPQEQQDRIFQPYIQLRPGAGLGLGLATVDRLVRAHGGSLGVISAGHGSLFWFELPKPRPDFVKAPELAFASAHSPASPG